MFAPQVPFNVFGFANYRLLQFVAGMVIGSLWLKGRLLPGWLAGIVCSVAVLAVVMRPHDTTWVHMMIWAPASVAFVYAILSFESILARHKWALLDLLADASYTIYLSHVQLTQSILHHLLKRLPQTSGHLGIGVAVATINVVVCCGVGVLIHIAVERPLLHRFGAPIGGHPKA
jgi:exopolysaccharide production protein ExoZ